MDVDCFCVRGLSAVEVLGTEEIWPVERKRISRTVSWQYGCMFGDLLRLAHPASEL